MLKTFSRGSNLLKEKLTHPIIATGVSFLTTTGISAIFGVLFWGAFTRLSNPTEVGQASTLISFSTAISILLLAGITPQLLLLLPRSTPEQQYSLIKLVASLGVIAVSVVSLVALGLLILVFDNQYEFAATAPIIVLAVGVAAVMGSGTIADASAVAIRQNKTMVVRNAIYTGGKALILVGFLLLFASSLEYDTEFSLLAWVLGAGVSLVWAYRRIFNKLPSRKGAYKEALWAVKKGLANHHSAALGAVLPPLIVPTIITIRVSAEDTAVFTIVWAISAFFFAISPALASGILARSGVENVQRNLILAVKAVYMLLVPAVIFALLFSTQLLSIFGSTYAQQGSLLLMLLALSALPEAFINLYIAKARVLGQLRRVTFINASRGILFLTATWFILPYTGVVGIGWVWLTVQVVFSLPLLVLYFKSRNVLVTVLDSEDCSHQKEKVE